MSNRPRQSGWVLSAPRGAGFPAPKRKKKNGIPNLSESPVAQEVTRRLIVPSSSRGAENPHRGAAQHPLGIGGRSTDRTDFVHWKLRTWPAILGNCRITIR